ncbi:MAG: SUMF1/EgtB/PvdO family nonheme iron enzyme, partial [Gemmataceae bacterium]
KCLSKRASDRYSTALDLADDLEQWATGAGDSASVTPTVAVSAPVGPMLPSSDKATGPALPMTARVSPRGLCSFGPDDADAFLRLLPGPRDRDELPESLAFWKRRIESEREEETFRVGLLYGPSGCGKTSLIRAGLMPRLGREIVPVYLEALPEGTEAKLLSQLGRTCPALETATSLSDAVALLRRGQVLATGRKLLVIIDQFEQWLHSAGSELATQPLVAALRQADGVHVQFLLLIRDDFWLGASRLFQELEIPLLDGHNIKLADLFDARHARTVLELFGQGYGCLPESAEAITPDQQAFLDQVVQGLSDDGKVISVRLSVFADMVKRRPWSPLTLQEIGGTDGAGITFLEEIFVARSANPEHRSFEAAARAALAALLPEAGGTIKGRMRSRDELLQATELPPRRFQRLLEILDRELHLITPSEGENGEQAAYHLTHDYLVCPLRDWLTQKQRASWRGRAQLVLEERTAQWQRLRQRRFLPSPVEYASIVLGVPKRRRKPEQQALVRAASKHYGCIGAGLMVLAGLLGLGAHEIKGRAQAQRLVHELLAVAPDKVEKVVLEELPAYRRWAGPILRELAADNAAEPEHRLRASLALLPADHGQVAFLQASLSDGRLDAYPSLRDELVVPAVLEDDSQRAELIRQAQAILAEPGTATATEAERVERGRRQARAAILLVRVGQGEAALTACRDVECLGHFIACSRNMGIVASQLLDCLERASKAEQRYALLLALGNFTPGDLPAERRQATIDNLIAGYRNDASAACHAACEWLLRRWKVDVPAAEPDKSIPAREWFVLEIAGRRLSFVKLPAGKFLMGSPANEKYRVADEEQHLVEITRPLAVLDREVSVSLWRRFLDDTGRTAAWHKRDARGNAFQKGPFPASHLDWQEAVEFCRWLTQQAGLPEAEQCYEQVPGAEAQWRFYPERAGFRLPTEAEWEHACRGDSPSTFSFGSAHGLLGDFAIALENSDRQPAPVGTSRPNPRGLFDMHGNVWEWCSDAKASYDGEACDPCGPLTGPVRQYRGGSYDNYSRHARCACRISEQLTARFPYLGFRVVCTLPSFERTAGR